jgi:hypothetical protein
MINNHIEKNNITNKPYYSFLVKLEYRFYFFKLSGVGGKRRSRTNEIFYNILK